MKKKREMDRKKKSEGFQQVKGIEKERKRTWRKECTGDQAAMKQLQHGAGFGALIL